MKHSWIDINIEIKSEIQSYTTQERDPSIYGYFHSKCGELVQATSVSHAHFILYPPPLSQQCFLWSQK